MNLLRENGGLDYAVIDLFEQKIKLVLPVVYKEFLHQYNGGLTMKGKEIFLIGESHKKSIIDKFFGLNLKPSSNLEYLLENYQDRFPFGIFPIGEDPGGNYICLSLSTDEHYGKIYFYDHEVENEDENGKLTWDNLYLIADSFTEFLEKLH